MAQPDFEGEVYRKTFELVDQAYDAIKAAKTARLQELHWL